MNTKQIPRQTEGRTDEPLSCDTSGYPLGLPTMHLIDKEIQNKSSEDKLSCKYNFASFENLP